MGQAQSTPPPPVPILPPSHPSVSSASRSPPPSCPMHQSASTEKINPLNYMPTLSQESGPTQTTSLSVDRTESSIPRSPSPDGSAVPPKWEYPSPQQFYNALLRKGWETPEEHVETMVEIHNFLNEMAWKEVLRWERQNELNTPEPQLTRFQGRPGELSPKALLCLLAGRMLPSRFNTKPPFDRHDWVIRRHSGEEVRYVIDYYEAPPELDGAPVFSLDVRPALDSLGCVKTRIRVATQEAWAAFKQREKSDIPGRT